MPQIKKGQAAGVPKAKRAPAGGRRSGVAVAAAKSYRGGSAGRDTKRVDGEFKNK